MAKDLESANDDCETRMERKGRGRGIEREKERENSHTL